MLLDMDEFNELKGIPKQKKVKAPEKKKVEYKTFKPEELVHLDRKINLEGYGDFKKEDYPYSINFYDFEVFMGDWLVVIINPVEKTGRIIANDSKALLKYYREHKREIWCGYNSKNYDTFILKSIILGLNPKKVSDDIIGGKNGWEISEDFRDVELLNFDISTKIQGLKQLEAFMGNDIRETEVSFDLDRPLTKNEMLRTVKYCIHDVEQTIEVFRRRKPEFDAHMSLIDTFGLDISCISSTQAQLTAKILGCKKVNNRNDEFRLKFVGTLRLDKYRYILDWFKNPDNMNYSNFLETEVCGIPHIFGWGGLHGCPKESIYAKGRIFHVDVTSYYPSIMIEYDMLTRNCKDKAKFKQVYDIRVALKKAGKKKEQAPYKIILNSTYGICKDRHSNAYDPLQANNVCINGQLMLLDLLEHLEGYATIIQSNTDGIILQVEDSDEAEAKMRAICKEWMNRTRMGLGFDEITEIWQGDVNNYLFKFKSGKLERKGAYVKELSDLDNDLPIVNKAIVEYLVNNIAPRITIERETKLIEFQKIVKVSSAYSYGYHNGELLTDKTYRVFASISPHDTYIGRCRYEGATVEKFSNTPEHCFIYNGDIKEKEVPISLDRSWYWKLAEKRLTEKFGINLDKEQLI